MPKLLHLLDCLADEQTRQIHQMLVAGIGPEYDSQTKTIGAGGHLPNLPAAVLRLRHQPSDITYAWGIQALAAAVLAGHSPVFFSPDRFAGPRALRWIGWLMGRGNVTFICPTFAQRRLAISRGIDGGRCLVIQPGVDCGSIRRRRDPGLRSKLGLNEGDFVVVAAGESSVQSAHDLAVWTCGILHVLDPRCKLLVWGTGPRAGALAELGHRLHQPELVKIANAPGRPPMRFEDLLPAADVCLVTCGGAAPTLPIAAVMAAGVPIVSTATPILGEMLEDRQTALMEPRRSPRALVQRVLDLREDIALRTKLITAARAQACERFSMARMLQEYRQILCPQPDITSPPIASPGTPRRFSHC